MLEEKKDLGREGPERRGEGCSPSVPEGVRPRVDGDGGGSGQNGQHAHALGGPGVLEDMGRSQQVMGEVEWLATHAMLTSKP